MRASQVIAQKRPALRVVKIEPSDWATSREGNPQGGVVFGLRTISDAEEGAARKVAIDAAAQLDGGTDEMRVDEYNDELVASIVAAAVCDPNDCTIAPRELRPEPAAVLRHALTSRAIRRLFHEYEVMAADVSPAAPHADDDEMAELLDLLADDDRVLTNRARRLAFALLDELRES